MPTNQLCHPPRGITPIVVYPVIAQVRAKPHISANVVMVVVVGLTLVIKGLAVELANIVVISCNKIYEVIHIRCGDLHMYTKRAGVVMVHLVKSQ